MPFVDNLEQLPKSTLASAPTLYSSEQRPKLNVATARITLKLPASHSLKDKRRVVKSICQRTQNKFNASIAEVDTHDLWQTASLGIACVSGSGRHAAQMLDTIIDFIESDRPDAEIIDCEIETL